MKFKFTLLIIFFISTKFLAQTDGINYKAIVKDGTGNVLANTSVDVQFDILASTSQTLAYRETHTTTTDANGLIILNIGQGSTSDVFSDIQWEKFEHYLNVQIDTGSGFIDMGTTEFMAAPYALHAEYANLSDVSNTANNLILKDGTSNEFALNYEPSGDKLRITENGISGSVLEIKDGELYLPQYTGSNNGPLKVDATGKVITESLTQLTSYNRFEFPIIDVFSNYTRMQKGVQFPDGITLTGIKAFLMDNESGSSGVHNTAYVGIYRMSKTSNNGVLTLIYRIDGADTATNQFIEFTETSLATSGANIIDNSNYIYFLQVWLCDNCAVQEVSVMNN
jgi:hypothetical protein